MSVCIYYHFDEVKLSLTQTIHPPNLPKRLSRGDLLKLENWGEYTALEAQCDDVIFKDCNLEGAVLVKTTCNAVRFEECNLRSAILEESNLSGVVFSHCDLTNASLRASTLIKTGLRSSSLNGVQANPQDLSGAIIEPTQAIQVVGLLGVTVQDSDG
jgi:uncharacterized protein YjbI with pentapeptide repeats